MDVLKAFLWRWIIKVFVRKFEAITTKNTQYLGDKKIKKPDIVFLIFICYNGIQLPTCGGKGKRHD